MELLESSRHLQPRHRVLYTLFSLLFLVSGFYYQDNLGGEGLSLPFNAVIWVPVLLIIGGGVLSMLRSGVWVRSRYIWLLLLFPFGIVLGGFLSGLERPGEWLVRLGVLVGGMLLWFSLLQYRLKRIDVEQMLYLLLAAFLLHAMVGVLQLAPDPLLKGWIPVADQKLLGMFQQPNLQASLMATAVALSLYLASLPSFSFQRWPMQALVYLTLPLAVMEVVGSGSRVGLLGGALSLVMLILARLSVWRRTYRRTAMLVALIGVGVWSGLQVSDGALRAYSKLEQMTEAGADARPHVYRIAFDVFKRSPWIGHGIGSFQREFQDERVPYAQERDASAIAGAPRFSHPHNELLFWMDEGGLLAVFSIFAAVFAVLLQLIKLGWQRGGAVASLLIPITLHTQVELPFYISTFHWLVLLVLLYVCFYFGARSKEVRLSLGAERLITGSVFVVVPLVSVFLMHSLLAQTGIMQYLKGRGTQPSHLSVALNNLYFRETGEYFTMRAVLYSGLQNQNAEQVTLFIQWAESFLRQIPDIQIYKDLAIALQYSGRQEEAQALLDQAHSIYHGEKSVAAMHETLLSGGLLYRAANSEDGKNEAGK